MRRIVSGLHILFWAAIFAAALAPKTLWACACGCGMFEVGTGSMLPTHPGGLAFLEWDHLNQNKNWTGRGRGSDDNNMDRQIRSEFFMAGIQYMFDRSWGMMAELPYWYRHFKTTDSNGHPASLMHGAVGDIRVRGIYSGLSSDMSTGLTFGVKLPSGDFTYPNFDRDTQIGTGSTDALLGAYHMGELPVVNGWYWFSNVQSDLPVFIGGGYRPGSEIDAAIGAYYGQWRIRRIQVAPLAQAIGSHRWHDTGALADFHDTGYDRLLLAPGVEVDTAKFRIYAEVGFPVYQFMNGNQLTASEFYKLSIGYVL